MRIAKKNEDSHVGPWIALTASLCPLMRLLSSLAITTIYVPHDQVEAMELGDRIVVMSQRRITQIGAPR